MNLRSVFTCLLLSESNFDRRDTIIGETSAVTPIIRFILHVLFFFFSSASVSVYEKIRIVMQQAGDCQLAFSFAFVFPFLWLRHSEVHLSEEKPAALLELAAAAFGPVGDPSLL